ncbi:hypothetical protein COOONC_00299 [Cooperia oncophora]
MLLETRTELLARSRKLVRLTNMMSNFTADSWRILNEAQHGGRSVDEQDWAAAFREWMLSVAEVVDDRRPIRRELNRPDDLANMHNKWTFPTALLYVLTVLTTCGTLLVIVDIRPVSRENNNSIDRCHMTYDRANPHGSAKPAIMSKQVRHV